MIVSSRQKDIILYLAGTRRHMTSSYLAKKLGVSGRTVRNEIKSIKKDAASAGFTIDSIRGKGYLLNITNEDLFMGFLRKLENGIFDVFSVQHNRVLYIVKRLLFTKDFLKLEDLTDELYVSLSTVHNDLKLVKEHLEEYHLRLINRPHYGSMVEGSEYMKRLCLANLLLNGAYNNFRSKDFLRFIDQELFTVVKNTIINILYQFQIDISDYSLDHLAVHITISCKRIEEGFIIEPINESVCAQNHLEHSLANHIILEIERLTGLHFPEAETNYIVIHLLSTEMLPKKEIIKYSGIDEARALVHSILAKLNDELNWDFSHDKNFIEALTIHLRPIIHRLRYRISIRNPLLDDLKKKYPAAFEGAVIASKCLKDHLQVDVCEHEIAFIALQIVLAIERMKAKRKKKFRAVIVSASGIVSAQLLYHRLQKYFADELDVVEMINFYSLTTYDLSNVDFVISTVPIPDELAVPVQVVHAFLEDRDIEAIKNFIVTLKNEIDLYLHPSRIFLRQDLPDKESVITFLCENLYRQNLVEKDYVDLVLEREAISPTSYGNLVAVPHPIKPVTAEAFWTVCTLERPIKWTEEQEVQFVCLLNIKKGSHGDLNRMFKKLVAITENQEIVRKLIASETERELIEILKNKL